uniref:Uncharacterized protein n=1 Tax=Branchiostoma floridae TaxID=7739 RepID=C3XSL5_BRAFL|eukprot:XP_002612927.1 hypothetical protein BRAFLDRAFT_74681 [Branchiostoma floridae]
MNAPKSLRFHRFESLAIHLGEIKKRGGRAIPVQCDHEKDDEVKDLFDRVAREQHGRLDILVNNAYSAAPACIDHIEEPTSFWDEPLETWNQTNSVGIRGVYICAVHAARLMVPARKGLIVNISSEGGLTYGLNPCYCVGKAAFKDRYVSNSESTEFSGRGIVSLAAGRSPPDYVRRLRDRLSMLGYSMLAAWIPASVKIPGWMLSAYYHIL